MKLNNTQLLNFVKRIKFSDQDKLKYQTQIDTLKSNVHAYITQHTDSSVIKIIQSGSWKKGTILHPKAGVDIDIDLTFFINPGISTEKDVRKLNEGIKAFLFQVYPNKTEDDFWHSPKTAGVIFKGTGLSFDIVPVVPISPEPYVWQPENGSRSYYYTSIDGQLKFNSDLKSQNANYSSIVRLLKKWKNEKGLKLSSFSIEIIQGWLEVNYGYNFTIEEALIRFFDLLGRQEFPDILFETPNVITQKDINSQGAVYIADPTNKGNNTAEYINRSDWNFIQTEVNIAFETLMYAQNTLTLSETKDLWKEVFGDNFNIENIV